MTGNFASLVTFAGVLIGPSVGLSYGPSSDPSLGNVSYAIGAAAFTLLFVFLAFKARHAAGGFVLLALFATALWTSFSAAYYADLPVYRPLVPALEVLRFCTWFGLLLYLLLRGGPLGARVVPSTSVTLGVVALVSAALASMVLWSNWISSPGGVNLDPLVGLIAAVMGLLLTEMLYRNTPVGQRWQIKFLCLSAGIFFAYDLFLYADAVLFRAIDPSLQEARGAVQALCAPLFAVAAARADIWRTNISLSRKVVVGSTTLIASGIYLSLAAAIGFWLEEIVAERGSVIRIVFLVGALAVLAVALFSGVYWAHVRVFVNKYFFKHKYDWREEWLRFMGTLGVVDEAPLEVRCVKGIADIVESPGGVMILMEEAHSYHAATWNFAIPEFTPDLAFAFGKTLRESQAVIDLEQIRAGNEAYGGASVPTELLDLKRAWLVIPLWHRRLVGLVVLAQPRAARTLDWEDYDLLGVIGRQAASYLAEYKAQEALDAAREFEIFNRRFAFVVHDVKNLVSQLTVLGTNFGKHGHRQEFRDDVVETLKDASAKMKRLMERISAFQAKDSTMAAQALEPIVRRVAAARPDQGPALIVDCGRTDLSVAGNPDRLEALIAHLIQNAADATGGGGTVKVNVRADGRYAVIDVTDDGPGMARDFVQRELFKPFQSGKKQGMGIGVYQCREYAREFGGNLEAISAPGQGTTMRVTLPVASGA